MSIQHSDQAPGADREKFAGSVYILPADQAEAIRLDHQHKLLKEVYGKILFCPFEEKGTYSVLDSGVGRASWICDIATQLSPLSDLQGIDIKDDNFPRKHPSNISFSINSVLALPDDWTDRFDIVHQRLLLGGIRSAEWPIALSQMYRVLRPGGWVQLAEVGAWHGGPVIEQHMRMQREALKLYGLDRDIAQSLPTLLKAAGFTDIHEEKREIPTGAWAGKLGEDGRDSCIAYSQAAKAAVLKSGLEGSAQTEEEYDRFTESLAKEMDETNGAGCEFYIYYAQRPTN